VIAAEDIIIREEIVVFYELSDRRYGE